MSQNTNHLSLPLPTPFNFSYTESYLQAPKDPLVYTWKEDWIYRALPTAFFKARVSDDTQQVLVEFEPRNSTVDSAATDVQTFIEDWWDLHRDLTPFYQLTKEDPILGPLVASHPGLRITGVPDLFECLAYTILGQQVNVTFAHTLKSRFIQAFGQTYQWQEVTLWEFPKPRAIESISPTSLRPLSISQRKAEYIIGMAKLIEAGELNKEKLKAFPNALTATKALTKHRGIGIWSANYLLLRCLRYPDAFPLGDAGLQNSIKHLLQLEHKPDSAFLEELAKPWTGWQAYATMYLWYAT